MIRVSAVKPSPGDGHTEFTNQSRKQVLSPVSEKPYTIAKKDANRVGGVIGQSVDGETIPTFKRPPNQPGVESPATSIQNPESKRNKNTNIDPRTNHPPNKRPNAFDGRGVREAGPSSEESGARDLVPLIGSTPRYEAPSPNVRSRQLVIRRNIIAAPIGLPTDSTHPTNQLGNGMKTPHQSARGKHYALHRIPQAKNPNILLGPNAPQREDGDSLKFICD